MAYNNQIPKISLKNAYVEFRELGVRASKTLQIEKSGNHLELALHVYSTLANKAKTAHETKLFCEFEALEKKYEPLRKKVIQKLSQLTSIQLRGQQKEELRRSLVTISEYCPNLKHLDVSSTDLRGDELKYAPQRLETLCLSSCKWVQERSLVALTSFKWLKELDLSYTKITGLMVPFLPKTLQKLTLLGCHFFKEENLVYIHPSIPLKTLDLRLGYNLSGRFFDGLNASIEYLILPAKFRFTFQNTPHLLSLPNLKKIDLSMNESILKAEFPSLKRRALLSIQPRIRGISQLFAQEAIKVRNSLKIDLQDIAKAIFDRMQKENALEEETDEELHFLIASHTTEAMKKTQQLKKQTLAITKALCRHTLPAIHAENKLTNRVIVENIIADLLESKDDDFSVQMKMQYGLTAEEFPKILAMLEALKENAKKAEQKK
jgi:Leucine-rich repeat (LRR) protein